MNFIVAAVNGTHIYQVGLFGGQHDRTRQTKNMYVYIYIYIVIPCNPKKMDDMYSNLVYPNIVI